MKYIFTLILLIYSIFSYAVNSNIIELSLTFNSKTETSMVNGIDVIAELSKNNSFPNKPSYEQDYASYYIPKKELHVLNSKLIVYDYEEVKPYFGCCVNPGNAVILELNNNIEEINAFSKNNKCSVNSWRSFYRPDKLTKLLKINAKNEAKFIQLSCKENDRAKYAKN